MSFHESRPDKTFVMERPKDENISRCRVISFQNETEWHKGLVPRNDWNEARTTHTLWQRRAKRWGRRVKRPWIHSRSLFHSCRSDHVPRSKVVLSHSGKTGKFRMTSERCRNEERGGAEVGCFPPCILPTYDCYTHFRPWISKKLSPLLYFNNNHGCNHSRDKNTNGYDYKVSSCLRL